MENKNGFDKVYDGTVVSEGVSGADCGFYRLIEDPLDPAWSTGDITAKAVMVDASANKTYVGTCSGCDQRDSKIEDAGDEK